MTPAAALERELEAEHLADRAARLLLRAGALIEVHGQAYAVRFGQGRRPMLTIDEPAFRKLAPQLTPRGQGWRLAPAAPPAPGLGRPGLVEGERAIAAPDGQMVVRRANLAEAPLDWLWRRGHLSAVQHAAGERLAADAHAAEASASLTMRWDPTPRGGGQRLDPMERATAARQRLRRAITAVGREGEAVLRPICIARTSLAAVERSLGLRPRTGKAALRAALQRLAAHYGMA